MTFKKSRKPGLEDGYDDGQPANKWGYWIALAEIDGMDVNHMPLNQPEKIIIRILISIRKLSNSTSKL